MLFGSFFFLHIKNGPDSFKKETAQMFIPIMKFLQQRYISRSFLICM